MENKQEEALINLLNEAPYILSLYILPEFSENDFKYAEMLENNLTLIEGFTDLMGARMVAKLLRKLIKRCNTLSKQEDQRKHQRNLDYLTKHILAEVEELKQDIKAGYALNRRTKLDDFLESKTKKQ